MLFWQVARADKVSALAITTILACVVQVRIVSDLSNKEIIYENYF